MTTLRYDAAASESLERAYATADVRAQRAETRRSLHAEPGERIIDIGSGPGYLLCEIASDVAPTGRVAGVDISPEMNHLAVQRAAAAGVADRVEIIAADATALPFPEADFDAAVSTQVLEYIDDVDGALLELHRVLRQRGRAVIVDTDWDSLVWNALDLERATRIAAAWNAHAPHPFLPRTLGPRLRRCGFIVEDVRAWPLLNTTYSEATYSYNIAQLIAAFVVNHGVDASDAEAWLADLAALDGSGEYFFSLNRYLFEVSRT